MFNRTVRKIIKAVSDELAGKEPEVEHAQVNVTDELMKLKNLLDQGVLSQEEFDEQKKIVLSGSASTPSATTNVSNSSQSTTNLTSSEPVRIESQGGDNTMVWAIIAAIAFFIFMMMISM